MNTYEKLKLDKEVEMTALNEVISKLLMNDKTIVPVNVVKPQIWVAKWINGEDTYNRGDAVWVNTESVDDFVKNKTEYIKLYLRQDKRYENRINQAESNNDVQLMYEILKEGVSQNDIFYLGTLTDPVQIKICKRDGTTQPPTNSYYWEDFWVTPNEEEVKNYILKEMYAHLMKRFNQHVYNYHLSGWTQSNFDNYLDTNLSNIPYDSHYYYFSHKAKSFYDGFDFVKQTETRLFGDGIVKWFRLWNSGFLEQGGVIDITQIAVSQDAMDGDVVTVNLNWSGEKYTPQTYNYVKTGTDSVYGSDSQFKVYENLLEINESNILDLNNTYSVKVTPITSSPQSYETYNSSETFYDICPVFELRNASFKFIKNNSISRYSFYTSGFTTHVS